MNASVRLLCVASRAHWLQSRSANMAAAFESVRDEIAQAIAPRALFSESALEWEVPGLLGAIPGDFNGDGLVNGEDLGLFLVGWGMCP